MVTINFVTPCDFFFKAFLSTFYKHVCIKRKNFLIEKLTRDLLFGFRFNFSL